MNWSYIMPAFYKTLAWTIIVGMSIGVGMKFGAAVEHESNQRQLLNCQEVIARNK